MEPIKIPPPRQKRKLHGSVIVVLFLAGISTILAIANLLNHNPQEKSESAFGDGWEVVIALFFGGVTLLLLLIAAILNFFLRNKK